ncbi:MAG: hypothetical protein ACT6FD_02955 [Methanosarcinaceae archaeon]
MKIKTFVVLLMLTFVLLAGCIDDDEPVVNETPTVNATSIEDEVPNENETPTVNETIIEDEVPNENETPMENETSDEESGIIEELPEVEPKTHAIYMEHYGISFPSQFEINKGDTVVWRNRQDPKRPLTLVSEDGLWENKTLGYGRTLVYTFNESGTYNYSVIGQLRMSGSLIVK